jgi:hypothetical protein
MLVRDKLHAIVQKTTHVSVSSIYDVFNEDRSYFETNIVLTSNTTPVSAIFFQDQWKAIRLPRGGLSQLWSDSSFKQSNCLVRGVVVRLPCAVYEETVGSLKIETELKIADPWLAEIGNIVNGESKSVTDLLVTHRTRVKLFPSKEYLDYAQRLEAQGYGHHLDAVPLSKLA